MGEKPHGVDFSFPCFHQAAAIVRAAVAARATSAGSPLHGTWTCVRLFTKATSIDPVQATAAHAEAEGLAGAGRHNEAEAAAAAAQRWLRRAAQAAQ